MSLSIAYETCLFRNQILQVWSVHRREQVESLRWSFEPHIGLNRSLIYIMSGDELKEWSVIMRTYVGNI